MTVLLLTADAVLTVAAGAAVAGLVRTPLTLVERLLITVVSGVLFSALLTFGLAVIAGLTTSTVLAGPAAVLLLALGFAAVAGDPTLPWRHSWEETRRRWQAHTPWFSIAALAAAVLAVGAIFAHTVYSDANGLEAGYPTVWADWSQHLSTAASFAVGGNLPPQNPLLSGTPLLYPFLPDFHAATLMALGLSPGLALAVPGAVLMIVAGLLVVALGRRLGLATGAGVIAALACFLGGGIGFIGLFADACTSHGFTATQCTLQYAVTHPGTGASIVGWTLHDLPGTVAAQPRAYDGLPSDGGPAPLPDQQWYTPLMAWWLPQRTLLFGFSAALSVLILVLATSTEQRRAWWTFAVAGALLGLLPLVHVQTLIAVVVVLLVLLLRRARREWLVLAGVALVLGTVRLAQLAATTHGSVTFGNEYPWLEPGWLAASGTPSNPSGRLDMTPFNLLKGAAQALGMLGNPRWWGFWLANLWIAVPLTAVVAVASLARLLGGGIARAGRAVTAAFPVVLLELLAAGLVIFALCNLVVFQSWDWDNTKLLVYWYLTVGLAAGALAVHWWRRIWPRVAAAVLVGPMLLTGALVAVRLLPWTPSPDAITGPYTVAGSQELQLAAAVQRDTRPGAVFLTFGRPNDPLLAVAGRIGVMGYYGWLWSYGIDFGSRYSDVQAVYAGCPGTPPDQCRVDGLLRTYNVSYVEIDDRLMDPGAIQQSTSLSWWAAQGFPVVARSEHITVYDVRGRA